MALAWRQRSVATENLKQASNIKAEKKVMKKARQQEEAVDASTAAKGVQAAEAEQGAGPSSSIADVGLVYDASLTVGPIIWSNSQRCS